MKLHSYSSVGVILSRKNIGEADRIISVFSKDFGKLSVIAKGIRRPKSKKRGHLEIFSFIKFQAQKTHGIDIITEVAIEDGFEDVKKDIKKVSLAYYFCEVVGKITHEGERNDTVYNLILSYLTKLRSDSKLKKMRLDFMYNILTVTGFWPAGKKMENPDKELESVLERRIYSYRVGKRMLE